MSSLWSNIFTKKKQGPGDPRDILGTIPIFSSLKSGELKEIERIVHVRTYESGEFIFREGDVGAGLFVIAEGRVDIILENRVVDDQPTRLASLDKGSFFGELSLLDNERRSAAARAAETSVMIGLFRPDLLDLIERNPRLGSKVLMNVARIIGERLRHADTRLGTDETVSEKPADQEPN